MLELIQTQDIQMLSRECGLRFRTRDEIYNYEDKYNSWRTVSDSQSTYTIKNPILNVDRSSEYTIEESVLSNQSLNENSTYNSSSNFKNNSQPVNKQVRLQQVNNNKLIDIISNIEQEQVETNFRNKKINNIVYNSIYGIVNQWSIWEGTINNDIGNIVWTPLTENPQNITLDNNKVYGISNYKEYDSNSLPLEYL